MDLEECGLLSPSYYNLGDSSLLKQDAGSLTVRIGQSGSRFGNSGIRHANLDQDDSAIIEATQTCVGWVRNDAE